MGKIMKTMKNVIGSSLLILGMTASVTVFADTGVRFTVHNLSNNNDSNKGLTVSDRNVYSSNVDQVCIFCHTPHNAKPARPLWNKATLTAATNFRLYTSSSTLSPTTRASALTADSPSLLCLGCHDGKTALNVLHNSPTGVVGGAGGSYDASAVLVNYGVTPAARSIQYGYETTFGIMAPANIGGTEGSPASRAEGSNLTDDHPIGFSYYDAWNTSPATKAALHDTGTVDSNSLGKIRFFNGKMECSTCHDPHVNYDPGFGTPAGDPTLRPFLVMSNSASSLCLACHNK